MLPTGQDRYISEEARDTRISWRSQDKRRKASVSLFLYTVSLSRA